MTRRRIAAAAALAVVLTACGDGPLLEDVGDLSQRIVHGDVTTTLPGVDVGGAEAPVLVKPVEEATWWNAGIGDVEGVDAAIVSNRVWVRGEGVNRFVQADPREVAVVLPDLSFPEALPPDAQIITSQLVFDVGSGLLDSLTSAAFGIWNTVPYTIAREQSQLAVLRIGQAAAYDNVDPLVGIQALEVEQGLSMVWTSGDYRYELFCRNVVDERVCLHMAENVVPLAAIAPAGPAATAASTTAPDS